MRWWRTGDTVGCGRSSTDVEGWERARGESAGLTAEVSLLPLLVTGCDQETSAQI